MRVSAPWKFHSKNFHLKIHLKEKINLKDHYEVKSNPYFENDTDEILLTFSDCESTINEKDKIIYHEMIVKCKVNYKRKEYYYPIITFVDDAYSVIRGYYLGFEKCVSDINMEKEHIQIHNKYFDLDFQLDKKEDVEKNDFVTYPFILIRDWKFDNEYVKKELVSLIISDYKLVEKETFDIEMDEMKSLLKKIGIDKGLVYSIEKFYLEDEFILEGTVKIDLD